MGLIGAEVRQALYGAQDPYATAGEVDGGYPHTHLTEELVVRVLSERRPRFWVEVGSMLGGSALRVAATAKELGVDLDMVCIDPFTGDVNMWAWEQDLARQGKWRFLRLEHGVPTIHRRFLANVKAAGFEDVITPLPATGIVGMRLLRRVTGWRPDVVYVDSAHEQDETFLELATAWNLLGDSGLLMGDDLDWPAVRGDVEKFAASMSVGVEVVGNQWMIAK